LATAGITFTGTVRGRGTKKAHAHVYGRRNGDVQRVPNGHGPAPHRASWLFCGDSIRLKKTKVSMPAAEQMLDHEKLEVYGLARHLAREGRQLLRQLPSGRADIADQFRRVNLSIALNIAEGGGEFAPKEKARFYRIARRSATECAAILDHMVDLQLLTDHQTLTARTLLRRIVSALVKLILATERMPVSRGTQTNTPPSAS
jgi:four helix bundle protein